MVALSYKSIYHPYVIYISIIILIGIEVIKNGVGNNSFKVLLDGSRSSFYNILGFIFDKFGFYVIALNFLSFGKYGEFKGALSSLGLERDLGLPLWANSILSLLLLDFLHYCFHRLYHRYDWLYNCHSFHHSAKEMSIFIVYRDHILEYMLKSRFILLLIWGPSHSLFLTIVLRDIFLLTNHMRWDSDWGWVGKVFVSPYFHKVHHNQKLMRYNFGAVFSFWDRIFKTEYKGPKVTSLDVSDNEFYHGNFVVAYMNPVIRFFSLNRIPRK